MQRLYKGDNKGLVVINLTPEDGSDNLDFTLVDQTACTIEVEYPNGTLGSWDAVATNVTTGTITLTHTLALDGTDLPATGPLKFFARMPLISGSTVYRSRALIEPIRDPFDTTY